MFAKQFFPDQYFPPGYFPKTGEVTQAGKGKSAVGTRQLISYVLALQEQQSLLQRLDAVEATTGNTKRVLFESMLRRLEKEETQRLQAQWCSTVTLLLAEV